MLSAGVHSSSQRNGSRTGDEAWTELANIAPVLTLLTRDCGKLVWRVAWNAPCSSQVHPNSHTVHRKNRPRYTSRKQKSLTNHGCWYFMFYQWQLHFWCCDVCVDPHRLTFHMWQQYQQAYGKHAWGSKVPNTLEAENTMMSAWCIDSKMELSPKTL